jgi:hypothetical protein
MHKLYVFLLASFFLINELAAQYSHQDILLGQSGTSLVTNLRLNYKPASLASYSTARNNMYKYIDNHNDTVTCVYTGLKRYLPSNATNPIAVMLDNNSSIGINAEHTYPQSKTVSDAGKSDLHHIYPTRSAANNGRGSIPFGEILPNNIDKWYFEASTLSSAPAANVLHLYSKQDNSTRFEPRDDHKGDVARAMFYYYTMYQSQANAADPNFFNQQKTKLCEWHLADPVDSLEWLRTHSIAPFQSGKVNPFVMDCSLPNRCNYCTAICATPNAITREEAMGLELFNNYPNPFQQTTTISYQLNRPQNVILVVYNNLGQVLKTFNQEEQSPGLYTVEFDASNLASGVYFYTLSLESDGKVAIFSQPLVKQ